MTLSLCLIAAVAILLTILAILKTRKRTDSSPGVHKNSTSTTPPIPDNSENSPAHPQDTATTDANYTYNNDDQPLFDQETLKDAIKNKQRKE